MMAEQLSDAGVPVFLADVKGDLSGLAAPGQPNEKLSARTAALGQEWTASSFPTEFCSLGGDGKGVPIRATIQSFGPLLLSRVMDLNATQESSLQLIFHWADQQGLELYNLADLRAVIQHLTSAEGKEALAVLTVSDHLTKDGTDMSAAQRETSFSSALEIAAAALTA